MTHPLVASWLLGWVFFTTVPYAKPFRSIDQRIALLASRSMTIPDLTDAKADTRHRGDGR